MIERWAIKTEAIKSIWDILAKLRSVKDLNLYEDFTIIALDYTSHKEKLRTLLTKSLCSVSCDVQLFYAFNHSIRSSEWIAMSKSILSD